MFEQNIITILKKSIQCITHLKIIKVLIRSKTSIFIFSTLMNCVNLNKLKKMLQKKKSIKRKNSHEEKSQNVNGLRI